MSEDMTIAEAAATLRRNGYEPVPIKPGTKQPSGSGWQNGGIPDSAWAVGSGVGVLCGHGGLLGLDVDTDASCILEPIKKVVPPKSVAKRGRTGETLFFRLPVPLKKPLKLPVDMGEKGASGESSVRWAVMHVETPKQTLVPPTLHPDTGRTYEWVPGPDGIVRTLYDTPLEQLPTFHGDFEAELHKALAAYILPPELVKACRRIACAPVGNRNNTLYKEVFKWALRR